MIEVPYASNRVFGGPDFKTLYVTVGTSAYAGLRRRYQPLAMPRAPSTDQMMSVAASLSAASTHRASFSRHESFVNNGIRR